MARTLSADEGRALGLFQEVFQEVVELLALSRRTEALVASITLGHLATQCRVMQLLSKRSPRPLESWSEPMTASLLDRLER